MEAVFLKLFNMSITASWLVLAIIALRFLLKKAPKSMMVLLWALVGIRLLCPFSFESVFSLIPSAETIPADIVYSDAPMIHSGIAALNSAVNPVISKALAPAVGQSANPMQVISFIASVVWIVGLAAMLLYTLISCLRIHRNVREAIPLEKGIWLCDHISAPFLFGTLHPRIYLPSDLNEENRRYVIAHEQAHIARHDHWWKPLGFVLLSVYWFQPVLWIAYVLFCRDIEFACDEKVIKKMGEQSKKPYANALLQCSMPRKMVTACPVAFGEVGVKGRIKSVLHYRKPSFWILMAALAACIVAAVCFLTNPMAKGIDDIDHFGVNMALFERVEMIGLVDEHSNRIVSDEQEVNDILSGLKTVQIAAAPISESQSEERDKTHRIILTGGKGSPVTLCFDSDCREVWIDDGVKPTFSYRVLNPQTVEEQFLFASIDSRLYPDGMPLPIEYFEHVSQEPSLEMLKQHYPQYFDLPTEQGLTVYVWQMAAGSFSCALIAGHDVPQTFEEKLDLISLAPTSMDEMRIIVGTYDLPPKDVMIYPITQVHSSYYYEINEAYCKTVEQLFWGE